MSKRQLRLERPLAVFDLETTGVSAVTDRIVEIAIVRLEPDGSRRTLNWRVNPGVPIPPGASAVHGITDADVADCPPFAELADAVTEALSGCDLGGFNCARFDVPLLRAEFARVGRSFPPTDARVVDAHVIFLRKEPRDLGSAVRRYLGREHVGAHGAEADAEATADVLLAQVAQYSDLPETVAELHELLRDDRYLDPDRRLAWREGEAVFAFGKVNGRSLRDVARTDAGFLRWILAKDFSPELKDIVAAALEGRFPARAGSGGDQGAAPANGDPAASGG